MRITPAQAHTPACVYACKETKGRAFASGRCFLVLFLFVLVFADEKAFCLVWFGGSALEDGADGENHAHPGVTRWTSGGWAFCPHYSD